MSRPLKNYFEFADQGDAIVVRFTGAKSLDEQTSQEFSEALYSLVDKLNKRKLIVDFSQVEYLSSGLLGVLITLNKKVRAAGALLQLRHLDAKLREVFEITKLNKLLDLQRDAPDDK